MTVPRILVVDDEADLRELLEITLIKMGLDVDSAGSLEAARAYLKKAEYDLVLTDMRLPDGMGIELVGEVSSAYKNTPIAVITAFGSADNAVAALKAGAFDYLSKPVGLDQLRMMVQSALRINKTASRSEQVNEPNQTTPTLRLIGHSGVMQDIRVQIARLSRSMAPVAINGESGSGKELAARDIHALSSRADKPFIAVNCGAIPEALMEAEFFGYRKGAFTGATDDRDGFFQAANGGTLMLDEVADLPLAMQVKLLRAIQERRVRKVGATAEEPVDVRLISATHQNLADCVEKGKFRQDLYYRLNVIELRLPPLRERSDDIGLLSEVILQRQAAPNAPPVLTNQALQALQSYSFPGNVRELENILERALAFAGHGSIDIADLALKLQNIATPDLSHAEQETVLQSAPQTSLSTHHASQSEPAPASSPTNGAALKNEHTPPAISVTTTDDLPRCLPDHLDNVERDIIRRALAKTEFNRTQAAELLGISFRQLRYRMQRLNIHEPE